MRFLNAVLTLVLLLMVAAGGLAYVFHGQIEGQVTALPRLIGTFKQ